MLALIVSSVCGLAYLHGSSGLLPRITVQALPHFLARSEKRKALFVDLYELARSRISTETRLPLLDGKDPETTKLNPISTLERSCDLCENCAHDVFDISLIEMRISSGDTSHELRFNHRQLRP